MDLKRTHRHTDWKTETERMLALHVEDPDRRLEKFGSLEAARTYWEEQGRPGVSSWAAWWLFSEDVPEELRSIDNWLEFHGWDAPSLERWRALYAARREYKQKLGLPARRSRYEHLGGRP